MPNGLVLADDATGALECASLLASLQLAVSLTSSIEPQPGIRVADTESRHLAPEHAAARIRHWLAPIQWIEGAQVFKKTDSTLRGNIAAELVAMLQANVSVPLVYVPAYPALGRTVIEGRLFVHGIPVAETEFAIDARQPVRSSAIADLFPQSLRGIIVPIADAAALNAALHDYGGKILVCDAASDKDIDRLAAVLGQSTARPWLAGPAGFVKAWAAIGAFPRRVPPHFPNPSKWLVVCGSLHPQSRRQASIAEAMGLDVVQSGTETTQPPEFVAAELARQALDSILKERPQAVLIMGGDTVRALWRAMGIRDLIPLPELLPGIAACLTPDKDLLFVTKAGGFGDDRLVERILDRLK
ncbi:MAG: four-carbon acid sugar kinase family protein [Bryobacteraceae bacterium]